MEEARAHIRALEVVQGAPTKHLITKNLSDSSKSCTIIVLGASGDLAKKKTFPALFALFREGLLPEKTAIVGFARKEMKDDEYKAHLSQGIKAKTPEEQAKLEAFKAICHYFATNEYGNTQAFIDMNNTLLKKIEGPEANRLFYLALPPTVFVEVCTAVKNGALTSTGWNRVIVEKPFGHDLESANKLSNALGALFNEDQLYRIDHYLGKEMVQNVMVLRFANMVFEPIWNRHYIKNVRIVFKEDFGTEGRGGYFDKFGIIRDVMQNHLMQLLALIAMEPPVSLSSEDVRDEKVKVLRSIPEIVLDDMVVGQYVSDGKRPGYLEDPGVPKDSVTPTYAQSTIWINNTRWQGVPFFLKTAKAVEERKAEIRIQFHKFPGRLFNDSQCNELVIRVQPNEAIYLKMMNKVPGLSNKLVISDLDLTYHEKFNSRYTPDAYERLILDTIRGDHSSFVRVDELSEAWRIFTPILHKLESEKIQPTKYVFGSRGPKEADDKAMAQGWEWITYDWPKGPAKM